MVRVRDQEGKIIDKIKKLQAQLQSQHRRVSAFIFQDDSGIQINGTRQVVQYLEGLENVATTLSSVCEEAGLQQALAGVHAQRGQEDDQDHLGLNQKKKLVVPLSMANYDEMKGWLVEDMKMEIREKGFTSKNKNTVYAYDRSCVKSTQEHENRRPDDWPEECLQWKEISFGIAAVGASFNSLQKSEICPNKPLEFFRLFIRRRLEANGCDPEKYYTESSMADKRIRNKSRNVQARPNEQPDINTQQANLESQRPSPEELANRSCQADNIMNSTMNSNYSTDDSQNNNSSQNTVSSIADNSNIDILRCHICKRVIANEEDPTLCNCSTKGNNIFVHWACNCKGCPLVQSNAPEHVGSCHICNEYVTNQDMFIGNILLCHCDNNEDSFVHYRCLETHGCNK